MQVARAYLIAPALLLAACSKSAEPATYADCLLQQMPQAKSSEALATVKAACKSKFPVSFDFDSIASTAAVSSWREVAAKSEFAALPDVEKSAARSQYFDSVIRPRVDPAYIEDARTQFDAFSLRAERHASTASGPAYAASGAPTR